MNFIYLSPHFPPNYYPFAHRLHALGVNVLGLAEEGYDQLDPGLRASLTEYYRVDDMHNYDQMVRAVGYFTHRYGKIGRIESLNEYWLDLEAALRTDFNIHGPKVEDIVKMRRKSLMKKMFLKADVKVAQGEIVRTKKQAEQFISRVGFPVVAKPDSGVGAADTFKISNQEDLTDFFSRKPEIDYIMEEFVEGDIFTFDGLVDQEGTPVFYTSHTYSQGIMETVNEDSLIYYYSLREIPADLKSAGLRVLKTYGLKERLFHFEFFRSAKSGELLGLEVNMRPPGGLTTDMFNFANDIDIYKEWANVVVHNRFNATYSRPYHCCYVSRKFNKQYIHSHEEILEKFPQELCFHGDISGVFSAALGNYGYLVRSPDLEEIVSMAQFIQETH